MKQRTDEKSKQLVICDMVCDNNNKIELTRISNKMHQCFMQIERFIVIDFSSHTTNLFPSEKEHVGEFQQFCDQCIRI